VDEAEAKISVFDHGLLYGDGVFEGIRVYSGRVFEQDAHIRRLYESARAIRLEIPMTREDLTPPSTRPSGPIRSPTATSGS
jgi:branched-chain amino acid aminotransferase